MDPIRILYFSDVLCIWAYIAQIRIEELQTNFQEQISIEYHFVPIFGNAREKLENRWKDRGGLKGYSEHVTEVVQKFNHIKIHPDIWTKVVPTSSMSCHLFLKAIEILEQKNVIPKTEKMFEKAIWSFRQAFFLELADISNKKIQCAIAKSLGISLKDIECQIDSGEAYASLSKDLDLAKEQNVTISPTLLFNEGRQRLNGNVRYRVIEANIRELLYNPHGEQSWC